MSTESACESGLSDADVVFLTSAPVREHHTPRWLRRAMEQAFPGIGLAGNTRSGTGILLTIKSKLRLEWLTHFGSVLLRGHRVFIAEFYRSTRVDAYPSIANLAAKLGCGYLFLPGSPYFPPETIRVAIFESRAVEFGVPWPGVPAAEGADTRVGVGFAPAVPATGCADGGGN